MEYIAYVLYSEASQKHYTGYTADLEERLLSHNHLGHDWTKRYRPWKLIFTKHFEQKSEALQYEKWLKTGAGRDFIKTLKH